MTEDPRATWKLCCGAVPLGPGWYATCHCWDPAEGVFPGAHYWDGKQWDEDLPFDAFSSVAFATRVEAEEWAHDHDPEQ